MADLSCIERELHRLSKDLEGKVEEMWVTFGKMKSFLTSF